MPDENETERRVDLAKTLTEIDTNLKNNTKLTDELHKAVVGNGQDGLLTKVAVLKASDKRQWYFIGVIVLALIGAAVRVFAF